jgi:GTP cyclohydrolase FolE2
MTKSPAMRAKDQQGGSASDVAESGAATGPAASPIEDVQSRADSRRMPINKVGIRDVFHPVRIQERGGKEQHTVANFNMYVALPQHFKGTHMSRFVEVLHAHEREISVQSFREMLGEMTRRLDATTGHIEMSFPYFVEKTARSKPGSRSSSRSPACARVPRRSRTTARTTSAPTSRSAPACASTSGSRT